MKTTLLILLLSFAAHLQAQENQPASTASNAFALKLWKELYTPGENTFFSPLNIYQSLSVLSTGAAGETEAELVRALQLPASPAERRIQIEQLVRAPYASTSIANALWHSSSFQVKPEFRAQLIDRYQFHTAAIDFFDARRATDIINGWTAEKTNGKIDKLFGQGDLGAQTVVVMVNTIYFNDGWKNPFDPTKTVKGNFLNENGETSTCRFMTQTSAFNLFPIPGAKVLEMPYLNGASMFFILPSTNSSVAAALEAIDVDMFQHILKARNVDLVQVEVPKFTLKWRSSLVPRLRSMGINTPFTDQADFSNMSDGGMHVSEVIHDAYLDVNEKGTEAAAATGVVMQRSLPTFKLNRTFALLLVDRKDATILFSGIVSKP